MLSPEILRQVRHIHLRTNRMVNELLQGSYHSAFKGQGMEFDQVREYFAGDDIRNIDWNVTARMNAPFVKEYIEEREVTVMLLVDVSASGGFGSTQRLKQQLAAEFAAVIAYSAIKNKDKIGVVLFTDQPEIYIPPRKGKNHVWKVVREVLTYQPQHQDTNLNAGLDFLNRVVKGKSICFLLSDFLAADWKKAFSFTNRKHDLIAVQVTDPREYDMPNVGLVEVMDAESGQLRTIDTSIRKNREQFTQQRQQSDEQLATFCKKSGVDLLRAATDQSYIIPLIRLFQKRGHRR